MAKVTIKDGQGNKKGIFQSDNTQAVGAQAQEEGYDVPFSCGVGACRTCVGKVTKGMEHIDKAATGPQHIDIEEDEILSCIAAVKPETPEEAEIEMEIENL